MQAQPAPLPARTLLGQPFPWVIHPTTPTQQKELTSPQVYAAGEPVGCSCCSGSLDRDQGLWVRSFTWLLSISHVVSFVVSSRLLPKASLHALSQE